MAIVVWAMHEDKVLPLCRCHPHEREPDRGGVQNNKIDPSASMTPLLRGATDQFGPDVARAHVRDSILIASALYNARLARITFFIRSLEDHGTTTTALIRHWPLVLK